MLAEESRQKIIELCAKYPDARSALLPALHLAQRDNDGWLSPEAMRQVSELMGLAPVEVESVASFYTMYNRQPVGKHLVQVCTNISCSLLGAEHIVEHIKRKLNVNTNVELIQHAVQWGLEKSNRPQ